MLKITNPNFKLNLVRWLDDFIKVLKERMSDIEFDETFSPNNLGY